MITCGSGQNIMERTLGWYQGAGFSLLGSENGALLLQFHGVEINRYNQLTATILEIRDYCKFFYLFVEKLAGFRSRREGEESDDRIN